MTAVPRVAFFPDSFGEVNGVAHTSRQLVAFATRRGWPMLCVHAGTATRTVATSSAVTRVELERGRMSFGLERDLRFDFGLWRHAHAVRAEVEAFGADVIHITGPNDVRQLGAYLAHDMGIPLVASWHTNLHDFGARRLDRVLGKVPIGLRLRLATRARQYSLRLLLDFYRLAHVHLAPNLELTALIGRATHTSVRLMERGVDTTLFSPLRRRRRGRTFRIGYVGRLSPEKNVRALVELESELLSRGIDAFGFSIVGDGSERDWLTAHLRTGSFAGVLSGEALASAYADMDVFVFPSETDTYGNVVLESMASGTPVIVTSSGGPKFLVQDNVNGFVRDGVRSWADAVVALMGNAALAGSMRRAARTRALEASWDRVFEHLYEAYVAGAGREAGRTAQRPAWHDLTVVARAVRMAFRMFTHRPMTTHPLASSAGRAVST